MRQSTEHACMATIGSITIFLSLFVDVGVGRDRSLLGFTSESARKERALERKIVGRASGERIGEYHRVMTAEPHHAGTDANIRIAEYYAEKLKEFGFDEVSMHWYDVLLPRPVERTVTLLSPQFYNLKLTEPPFSEDKDSYKEGVLPPFNAYAADGDVTTEAVYVNYGIPNDYEVLDSLGISVKGKIVIARYGKSWRGIKVKVAVEHGAIGCLLYSDPADDGYVKGDVMPKGKWRPEFGVQRGSVMDMPTYPGDPQTPMRASKKGVERIPLSEVVTLQKIPVLPVSYGDAFPIMRNISGEIVPEAWRGGLPITYHIGPGPAKVHMKLKSDWSTRPIVDVVGIIRGREEPDKIVMVGSHRDAWTFGGRDPISGAASLLETGRLLGNRVKRGDRPKRSIAIASWDAEEYGLIGSVEYGEEFFKELRQNLIVYLNRESYMGGDFEAGGVHSLEPFINEIARTIKMPDGKQTIQEAWAAKAEDGTTAQKGENKTVRLEALGSGSDYTVFLDHLGLPSVTFGFSSENGIYHSRYDSRWFFTTYGDPGFVYGEVLSELVAIFLLRMANADILPFDYTVTAETIDGYLDELTKETRKQGFDNALDFSAARKANAQLSATATVLKGVTEQLLRVSNGHKEELRELNTLLVKAEQKFTDVGGLPGRPWFRHQIYAPGFYTGYGVKTLPGVREAIEKGDIREADEMLRVLERSLKRVQGTLLKGVVIVGGITGDKEVGESVNFLRE